MKDYSAMSDYDINLLVNRSLGLKHYPNEEKKVIEVFGDIVIFEPCNNPADAWPIIVANKIWLRELYGNWDCKGFPSPPHPCGQVQFSDTNPLRAAMIVYLMMKDTEKCDG